MGSVKEVHTDLFLYIIKFHMRPGYGIRVFLCLRRKEYLNERKKLKYRWIR